LIVNGRHSMVIGHPYKSPDLLLLTHLPVITSRHQCTAVPTSMSRDLNCFQVKVTF